MKWILLIKFMWPGYDNPTTVAEFATQQECLESLKNVELVIRERTSENEWAGFKACLPAASLRFNDTVKFRKYRIDD